MAITFSGQKLLTTPSNSNVLANQNSASIALKFRFEPGGNPAQSSISFLVSRNFYSSAWIDLIGAGTAPNTVKLQFAWRTSATQVTKNYDLSVGVVYHLAMTYDQGSQVAWVNGQPQSFGTLAVPTGPSNSPLKIGGWDNTPGAGSLWTIDDVAVWNGYVLTAADVASLRDGVQAPAQIGAGASWRGEWTLAGPTGSVPAVGDAGLANAFGDATYNLTGSSGTGSIVYADPLVWAPSARIRSAYVGTSGRTVFVFFKSAATGDDALPQVLNATPTVSRGGTGLGPLTNPLCSGVHKYVMYTLPAGVTAAPGDSFTLDAPANWVTTSAGAVEAAAGTPLDVRAGTSCLGTPKLKKTLRVGINFEWFPTGSNALNWIPKNLAKVLSAGSGVATRDASGKPLTLTGTSAEFALYQNQAQYLVNKIDSTGYPGPTGLFAIGWDDLNPASPTTWVLASLDATTTTVTERVDLRNPGVGGIGQVRVFDVQRKASSTVATTDLKAVMTNAAKAPQYDNLKIIAPGEFDYADGQPVSLNLRDPYAISPRILDRFRNAGSIRLWQLLMGSVNSFLSEPEHTRDLTDFTWGWRSSKQSRSFGYVSAAPYSRADTPYFYSQVMGSKYAATLATAVDAATTTLNISDAQTAPVLVGQRLFLDSEVVRVDDVNGTTVTVTRGMEDTTPASHQAGAIQVGYRNSTVELGTMPFDSAVHVKFTTDTPHKLLTGVSVTFSGSGWPSLACTDGRLTKPSDYAACAVVTGANTFVARLGPYQSPGVTLSGTTGLNPASQTTTVLIGDNPQVPYPLAAKLANELDAPNLYLAIPHMATKDFVLKVARQVRDSIDPGRTIWLEVANETWNTGAGYVNQNMFFAYISAWMYPGQYRLISYAKRTDEVAAIFRQVFDEGGRNRSGQVKCFFNVQYDTLNGKPLLDWAAAQSPPVKIDGLAASPYINTGNPNQFDAASAAAFANLDPDQAIDLWIHALAHRADAGGVLYQAGQWKNTVAAYAAAVGNPCKFMSYEGGLEIAYTSSVANFKERNRDLFYHPNFYIAEQDFYGMMQQAGFELFNIFCSACDWNGTNGYLWGLYHWIQQPHGRGDGSDGKADNRLCQATPGFASSKTATTNQDLCNVSVRGQAWLDWNSPAGQSTVPRKPAKPFVTSMHNPSRYAGRSGFGRP